MIRIQGVIQLVNFFYDPVFNWWKGYKGTLLYEVGDASNIWVPTGTAHKLCIQIEGQETNGGESLYSLKGRRPMVVRVYTH